MSLSRIDPDRLDLLLCRFLYIMRLDFNFCFFTHLYFATSLFYRFAKLLLTFMSFFYIFTVSQFRFFIFLKIGGPTMALFNSTQQSLFNSDPEEHFLNYRCVRCPSLFQVKKILVLSPGEVIKRFLPLCSICRSKL